MERKPLRIAQVAPVIERVPPKQYGGTERVVHALTEELVGRGHDVTLFASGDSVTSAKLESVYPVSLREAKIKDLYGFNDISVLNIGMAYMKQSDFDVIHDHNGHLSIITANISRIPSVLTLHGAFTPTSRRLYKEMNRPWLVAISKSQHAAGRDVNIKSIIYNGLAMDHYPYNESEGYLLYVGRIAMEKGVHYAIEAAQALHKKLIIAAKLDSVDMPYFKEYIGPRLSDGLVQWVGEVDERERNELMSKALCLLHPVMWKEPFGLTMIEAMACGTPVIAFNRGSIPEIVREGETGYAVDDVEEMMEAILRVHEIDRAACRRYVLDNFNASIMVDGYESLYYQAVRQHEPWKHAVMPR